MMLSTKLHLVDFSNEPPRIGTNQLFLLSALEVPWFHQGQLWSLFRMFTPPRGNCNKWHSMMVSFCKRIGILRNWSSRSSSSSVFSLVNYVTLFKRHIIFEFFTQNPPKSGWWNWWLCLKRLLNPRVYVLYHASHSPKVSWTCPKSFIRFFSF